MGAAAAVLTEYAAVEENKNFPLLRTMHEKTKQRSDTGNKAVGVLACGKTVAGKDWGYTWIRDKVDSLFSEAMQHLNLRIFVNHTGTTATEFEELNHLSAQFILRPEDPRQIFSAEKPETCRLCKWPLKLHTLRFLNGTLWSYKAERRCGQAGIHVWHYQCQRVKLYDARWKSLILCTEWRFAGRYEVTQPARTTGNPWLCVQISRVRGIRWWDKVVLLYYTIEAATGETPKRPSPRVLLIHRSLDWNLRATICLDIRETGFEDAEEDMLFPTKRNQGRGFSHRWEMRNEFWQTPPMHSEQEVCRAFFAPVSVVPRSLMSQRYPVTNSLPGLCKSGKFLYTTERHTNNNIGAIVGVLKFVWARWRLDSPPFQFEFNILIKPDVFFSTNPVQHHCFLRFQLPSPSSAVLTERCT